MSRFSTGRLAQAGCTLLLALSLAACGGGGPVAGSPAPGQPPAESPAQVPANAPPPVAANTVVATASPAQSLRVTVGTSQGLGVTFTSSTGDPVTDLRVSGLSSLPAGWSASDRSFSCATVAQDAACVLGLTYAPMAAAAASSFDLAYSFTDAAGQARTGSVAIGYEAVAASRAYIVNFDDHNLRHCLISGTGALSDCATTADGPLFRPTALAFSGSTAYVLTDGDDKVYQCTVAASGAFGDCKDSGATQLDSPYGIAVHGRYVYAVSTGNGNLTWCVMGADGGLGTACAAQGDPLFGKIFNLGFHGERVYLTDSAKHKVFMCDLEPEGGFGNCRDSGATLLDTPEGLAIAGSTAYVTNYGTRAVVKCTIGSDGLMSACSEVLTNIGSSSAIAVSGSFAYISQGSDHAVLRCAVDADGSLSGCQDSGANLLNYPLGIALH